MRRIIMEKSALDPTRTLLQVWGASVQEIDELLANESPSCADESLRYALVLRAYLLSDVAELVNLERIVSKQAPGSPLEWATKIRLHLRRKDLNLKHCKAFLAYINHLPESNVWLGELEFLLALSFETLGENQLAKTHYESSYRKLRSLCLKKAFKARLNALVAESRISPESRFLPRYMALASDALAIGSNSVAGVCYLNVSREFQKLSAFELAISYADKALETLSADYGSLHFYLTLAHRCDLLIDLNRLKLAEIDYQETLASPFLETQSALRVLEAKLSKLRQSCSVLSQFEIRVATPTWRERWCKILASANNLDQSLSETDEKILRLLASKARNKFELIQDLYGEKVSYFDAENRLKVALSRLRRKKPGIILFRNEKYEIADPGVRVETA